MLKLYGSLEGILENTDKLKGKQKEKVEQFADQGRLSKTLATIDVNVPIKFDAKKFIIDPPNKEALGAVFKELEFRTLANQILGSSEAAPSVSAAASTGGTAVQGSLFGNAVAASPASNKRGQKAAPAAHALADKNVSNVEHKYHLVDDAKKRAALIKKLNAAKHVAFDTETTGIDPNEAELVGMSFAIKAHEAYYIPFTEDQDEVKSILEEFKPVFENEAISKIAQNIKYDACLLYTSPSPRDRG